METIWNWGRSSVCYKRWIKNFRSGYRAYFKGSGCCTLLSYCTYNASPSSNWCRSCSSSESALLRGWRVTVSPGFSSSISPSSDGDEYSTNKTRNNQRVKIKLATEINLKSTRKQKPHENSDQINISENKLTSSRSINARSSSAKLISLKPLLAKFNTKQGQLTRKTIN